MAKQGNSLVLLLDADLLQELGIDENTPVSVTTDGKSLRIAPAVAFATKEQVAAALQRVNARWGNVLKKLAE